MQTFLPYPDMIQTARCLDYRRLGKQRVECLQILNALEGRMSAWANHPATKMWRGYENSLKHYANIIIDEWIIRGYKNTMTPYIVGEPSPLPPWYGNAEFHASHRSNLLRKLPEHYSQFGWTEPNDLPYIWPENV